MTLRQILIITAVVWGVGSVSLPTEGAVISAGTPTTSVPTSLFDPLVSLTAPLAANQFLLPIQIAGANGLQDWTFDLTFNDDVVTPLDVGGLFQSVYQAEFNVTDTTLSNITSSGFLLPDVLQGIAGFSSGVSGDGLLAFVLFQFQPGQEANDPNFGIDNPIVTQQVPEPRTLALLTVALAGLSFRRILHHEKHG